MTTYKPLNQTDQVQTRTLLHEAIPLTGSISSGSYTGNNIKNFSHGMFQSVYDYPYLSSSANHIYDITFGYHSDSPYSGSSNTQNAKKINIYNQMAQVLMGYDVNGNIQKFDQDGDIAGGGSKIQEAIFITFSRLLVKDEIKKGSFNLTLGVNQAYGNQDGSVMEKKLLIHDASGSDSFFTNSPTGEYGILYATGSTTVGTAPTTKGINTAYPVGLIFYQAGVAVISGSIFMDEAAGGILHNSNAGTIQFMPDNLHGGDNGFFDLTGSSISGAAEALRLRIDDLSFNNTIELNSSIYFCRASHNEFNFSSNPTYIDGAKIRVKGTQEDPPVAYITTIGLYSADRVLLAVGKLSEPIRKDPSIELTFRARLDY